MALCHRTTSRQRHRLAALATIVAAKTNTYHGSLASGYKALFLVSIGLFAVAILIVAIQTLTLLKESA